MSLQTRGLFARFTVLVAIVAVLLALVWALMNATPMRADPERWLSFLGVCATVAALGFLVIAVLRMEVLGSILLLLALACAVGRAAVMLTYVVYGLGRDMPLRDAVAARADAALGFHWPGVLDWLNANPAISDLLASCHQAYLPQLPVLLMALALAARLREAQVALLAGIMGLLLTSIMGFLMPTYGPYAYFGLTGAQHPNIELVSAAITVPGHALVRSGAVIDLDARGLARHLPELLGAARRRDGLGLVVRALSALARCGPQRRRAGGSSAARQPLPRRRDCRRGARGCFHLPGIEHPGALRYPLEFNTLSRMRLGAGALTPLVIDLTYRVHHGLLALLCSRG
jgi:hypothetical protein